MIRKKSKRFIKTKHKIKIFYNKLTKIKDQMFYGIDIANSLIHNLG